MSKKKIGIIGSGVVAQVLGSGFIAHGYEVMLGTRDSSKLADWKVRENNLAAIGSPEETAAFGQIIIIAVKGLAAKKVVEDLAANFAGKTVIDTTNPTAEESPVNGVLKFFTDINFSLMEQLQKAAPAANFVKAFNSVGSHLMVNPSVGGQKPTMFIAGNSENARHEVSSILAMFGWEIADMGKAEAARAIEPLCMLWCIPGFIRNEWQMAFKLLK